MNILLLRTWKTNIGNGFIEKGAKVIMNKAFPEAEIHEVSGYAYRISEIKGQGHLHSMRGGKLPVPRSMIKNVKQGRIENSHPVRNSTTPAEHIDLSKIDLVVFPGCILNTNELRKYEEVFNRLNENNVPAMILGGGSTDYSSEEKEKVISFLNKYGIESIITRNNLAYDLYNEEFDVRKGIDCAYFIDEWYEPPTSKEPLTIFTFDKRSEPTELIPESASTIIRPHHNPFELPFSSPLSKRKLKNYSFDKENFFISDSLTDYLFFYANADCTYSDRVHACIPTLAYGNEAYFSHETLRSGVFDRVIEGDVQDTKVSVDQDRLEKLKEEQVSNFKEMAKDLL